MNTIALITTSLLLVALPLNVAASNVSKITRPVSVTDGEQRYAQIRVTCNDTEQTALIRKDQGAFQWCVDGLDEKCSRQKLKAAKLACRSSSLLVSSAILVPKAETPEFVASSSNPAQSERDRFEIEAELISIKQKELNLRRKTLEIQKRKLSDPELTSR